MLVFPAFSKTKPRTETKDGKGIPHSGTKKKLPTSQVRARRFPVIRNGLNLFQPSLGPETKLIISEFSIYLLNCSFNLYPHCCICGWGTVCKISCHGHMTLKLLTGKSRVCLVAEAAHFQRRGSKEGTVPSWNKSGLFYWVERQELCNTNLTSHRGD